MKKNEIKQITKHFFLAIILLLGFTVLSCEIGLGPAVDMEAPKVTITSHQSNDSVPQSFSLQGTLYDNEGVTLFNIDFEDADLHYQIVPGQEWQKKTANSNGWQTVTSDDNNYCTQSDNTWNWSIVVNTDERTTSKTGHTYNLLAIAQDAMGNSGKESKVDLSLIVDSESPDVSVYKPEIFSNYLELKEAVDNNKYQLKDGNVISSLLNGTIQLFGRQDQALAFKALRIEFDNGQKEGSRSTPNSATSVESIEDILNLADAQISDAVKPTTYFAKTITGDELREWTLTVNPEEWATNASGIQNGLNTGLHIIRIISTSLSNSNAWQRKVLGYFLWYPEADKPWITISVGDDIEKDIGAYECYPGSNISGNIQDDDGITSFESIIYKKNDEDEYVLYEYPEYVNPKVHELPQTNSNEKSKYSAWTVETPVVNGKYKLYLKLVDMYGSTVETTKYFVASDVSAPRINITTPTENSSAIIDASGNINFQGTITDDGVLKSFAMVWLNPALRNDPDNKIKYLTGKEEDWSKADVGGYEDEDGNILYKFQLRDGQKEFNLNRTYNLFSDFKLGTTEDLLLIAQDFIFRASDGNKDTIKSITLTGDSIAPELSFNTITIGDVSQSISETPTFESFANNQTSVITGTWSDKFNQTVNNTSKVFPLEITWGTGDETQSTTVVPDENGTWSATINSAPRGGGTITAILQDFGGNKKTIQGAVRIETSDLALSRIGCLEDDASYGATTKGSTTKLHITLEFTKNTKVDTTGGVPYLELNTGNKATYKADYPGDYGDGKPVHVFEYEVKSNDTNVDKLKVTAIKANGAKWSDAAATDTTGAEATTTKIVNTNLTGNVNLDATRTITIDTKKPYIEKITCETANGWYNKDASVLLKMEFSENVTIENIGSLKLQFNHKNVPDDAEAEDCDFVSTTSTQESGAKYALFTYVVQDNDARNVNEANLELKAILHDGVVIKDAAGNTINENDWTPKTTPNFGNVVIDTTKPNPPSMVKTDGSAAWTPAQVITDEEGVSFKITGEKNSNGKGNTDIEYTTDGANWVPYIDGSTVTLSNNGNYTVKARQTDKAGNTSAESTAHSFIINKGELLSKITTTTPSGTYSRNTENKKIDGQLEFRTSITISKAATVTLNIKNGTNVTEKNVPIEECKTADAEGSVFTFKYDINNGDEINPAGFAQNETPVLDVTGWNLGTVKLNGKTASISFPASTSAKRLKANRTIKIFTGNPSIVTNGINFVEEGTENNKKVYLTIEYNRAISKVGGTITLTQDTSEGKYHVPTVLTAEEYNELIAINDIKATIQNAYKKGVNGAEINDDNTLTNNTETKYILDFDTNDTNEELVKAFTVDSDNTNKKTAKKHIVTIPVVADEVDIINKNTIKIDLNNAYKLPVKGADYSIDIPAEIVIDDGLNKNITITGNAPVLTSPGVEKPVIRINKPSYTIQNAGNTANANANMTVAQSAQMKIDCRTPDLDEIKYSVNPKISNGNNVVTVNERRTTPFETKKSDPTAPTTASTNYTLNNSIPLASGDTYQVNTYDNAYGVKIAIIATTKKGTASGTSYEYATRTVLKFNINSYWNTGSENNVTSTGLSSKQLKVWVMGGDAPYGGNSKDPFPLSWSDPSHFKLMRGSFTTDNMKSQWYLVMWDISSATFHGFAIGTVPSDADSNGPDEWIPAENSWVTQKMNYILYPGETLIMDTANTNPSFWFRPKNRTTR